jgi:hypothetical protein
VTNADASIVDVRCAELAERLLAEMFPVISAFPKTFKAFVIKLLNLMIKFIG